MKGVVRNIGHPFFYNKDRKWEMKQNISKKNKGCDLNRRKPKGKKGYNYEKPEENYRDINEFILEKQVAQENIDAEMKLYEQLQEAVKVIRNSDKELIEEIQDGLRGYSIFDNEEGKMWKYLPFFLFDVL